MDDAVRKMSQIKVGLFTPFSAPSLAKPMKRAPSFI